MATQSITVAENVYRGGTIVAPQGSVITPDMAYALGVGKDGKVDQTLSTDDLLERARETGVNAAEGSGTVTSASADDKATRSARKEPAGSGG